MIEDVKRQKRGFISEEDISTVLQRYSATTVLALLQELAQVQDEKFDWDAMVKKTSTGITNAREYQMLWRHLAYHTSFVEIRGDDVEPLDDDSDLDYELEAVPTVAPEASAEAVACVKVLIASGMPSNSTLPNGSTVEAPLTINIPNGQSARAPLEILQPSGSGLVHGTNITVPVSVQKQPLPAVTSAEGLDTNGFGSGNLPPRRKRKPWSAAEDMELIAAVKKCGEGNWANILKGDFKSERSASQLSQRWNIIRKRKGNSSLGGSSQLSEAQLAARRAVSLALNMPMIDKLKASFSPVGTSSAIMPNNSIHPVAETSTCIKSEPQPEYDSLPTLTQRSVMFSPSSKPDSNAAVAQRSGILGPTTKKGSQQSIVLGLSSRVNLKAQSTKPSHGQDGELVKATAVAAGARIATPSDAASLLRAAQAKNAVHIMPGGASMIKASMVGSGNSLPSNVHYIRTGLATTFSTYSSAPNASRTTSLGHSVKYAGAIVQGNQRQTSPKLNVPSEPIKVATSSLVSEVDTKGQNQTAFVGNSRHAQGQEGDGALEEQIKEDHVSISGDTLLELVEEDLVKLVPVSQYANLRNSSTSKVAAKDDSTIKNCNQIVDECSIPNVNHMLGFCDNDKHVDMDICENHSVGKEIDEPVPMDTCENPSVYVKQEGMESMIMAGGEDKRNLVPGKEPTK